MRQHPIPQNVLDVEFKLFTKFTLKEFVYLAIGVSIGGLFLYFTSKGQIPGIIGIPLFIVFAGLGAFFALVPINDQPADRFITNFFTAINRPTQRTWLNSELKNQRSKPLVQTQHSKLKIIGASKFFKPKKDEFNEQPGDDIFTDKNSKPITEAIKNEEDLQITPDIDDTIIISEENVTHYQFIIKSVDKLPGNINIWLCTKDNRPVPNINTYLKDSEGKILYANRTGKNGYFLTNRIYPDGVYNIEFEGADQPIPTIKIVLSKKMGKLPFKITLQ